MALDVLLYRAWAFSRGIEVQGLWDEDFTPPRDLSCLNGFRIYVALLNRLYDKNWKHRLDAALARLRGRLINPTILLGYTSEALPCNWQSLRHYTDHAVLDRVLDKYVHQKLYFSPPIPTMTTMGATNMIFLRAHAAVEVSPILRPDEVEPSLLYFHHTRGLDPFEGSYLIYVDVCREVVR
ncbi:MAG: hypothetical protein ACKPKO_41485, partial [Candidatus Fonsibacter sp.]